MTAAFSTSLRTLPTSCRTPILPLPAHVANALLAPLLGTTLLFWKVCWSRAPLLSGAALYRGRGCTIDLSNGTNLIVLAFANRGQCTNTFLIFSRRWSMRQSYQVYRQARSKNGLPRLDETLTFLRGIC